MAVQSAFLEKQHALQRACFDAGYNLARQQLSDMLAFVLRDPAYIKTDIFGSERIQLVDKGIDDYLKLFKPAWEKTDETDYYRAKLDDGLRAVHGDGVPPFEERYEFAPEYDYRTGRWKKF